MSDSGSIKFPPVSGSLTERAAPAIEPVGSAQLIGAPDDVREDVRSARRPLKLGGEVVRQNRDGSVRVRTERGDIDIRLPEGQPPPERGQRIEIEIRPAAVRPAPTTQTPPTEQPRETVVIRSLPPQAASAPPQDRTVQTPTEINIRSAADPAQPPPSSGVRAPAPETAAPAQIVKGAIVRLLPLPPPELQPSPAPAASQGLSSVPQIGAENTQTIISAPAPLAAASPPESLLSPDAAKPALPSVSFQQPQIVPTFSSGTPPSGEAEKTSFLFPPLPETIPLSGGTPQGHEQAPVIAPRSFLSPAAAPPLTFKIEAIIPPPAAPNPAGETPPAHIKKTAPGHGEIKTSLSQPPSPEIITATVTGKTADGFPILTLFPAPENHGQAYVMLFSGGNIPIGTQFQLTPQAQSAQTATPPSPETLPFPVALSPGPWPLMDEILQNIMQISPQATQTLVNISPSPASPAQMSPAMLFFIAAVRGGDLSQWLGERVTETLRREGRAPLLSRIAQESASLSRLAAEPLAQEWRAVNLPMYHQGEMQKIALYYRHERAPDDGDDGKDGLKGTRFVFDLSLSAMGRVQVDGLFRPVSSAGKRLDLVLRTEQTFSAQAQSDMRRLYAQALRDTQITGELSFQSDPEHWFSVAPAPQASLGVSA